MRNFNKKYRRELGLKKVRKIMQIWRQIASDMEHLVSIEFYADNGVFAKNHLKARKRCSCFKCGNFRRYYGKTVQERRQDERDAC